MPIVVFIVFILTWSEGSLVAHEWSLSWGYLHLLFLMLCFHYCLLVVAAPCSWTMLNAWTVREEIWLWPLAKIQILKVLMSSENKVAPKRFRLFQTLQALFILFWKVEGDLNNDGKEKLNKLIPICPHACVPTHLTLSWYLFQRMHGCPKASSKTLVNIPDLSTHVQEDHANLVILHMPISHFPYMTLSPFMLIPHHTHSRIHHHARIFFFKTRCWQSNLPTSCIRAHTHYPNTPPIHLLPVSLSILSPYPYHARPH